MSQEQKAFQDFYPDNLSYCYGCGTKNEKGLHIQSHWDGEESVAFLTPRPEHTAIPGFVYGGLLASLVDCHSTGTASAAKYRAENRAMDTLPARRFLTASLHVDFLKPTPLGVPLEIRGRVTEMGERKVVVESRIIVDGKVTVRGSVVAVLVPEALIPHA